MTALFPSEWSEIGTTADDIVLPAPLAGVPGPLTVLGPLVWWPVSGASPPQYPAEHGCLVAVIDAVGDPRPAVFPSLGELVTNWTNFIDIVGANNNLAYRNFNVIDLTADSSGAMYGAAEVIIPGAPRAEMFDIRITVPECEDVEWQLLVPREIAHAFKAVLVAENTGLPDRYLLAPLERGSSLLARNVAVRARQRHRCIVRVRARRVPSEACTLVLTQSSHDVDLGRVTFSVGPRPRREPITKNDGDRRRSE